MNSTRKSSAVVVLAAAVIAFAACPAASRGATVTDVPLYTFSGDSAGDFFGIAVSGAGDVNGDGFADLIVGATGDDNNGGNSGSAQVLSGATGLQRRSNGKRHPSPDSNRATYPATCCRALSQGRLLKTERAIIGFKPTTFESVPLTNPIVAP